MSPSTFCLLSLLLLCVSSTSAIPHDMQKRLQWRTFVVCPGGEIALGEKCNTQLEKKALPHFLGFRRYYNSIAFPQPRNE